MSILRQVTIIILLLGGGVVIAARYVPASHQVLGQIGVPEKMISIMVQDSPEAGGAARSDAQDPGAGGPGGPRQSLVTTSGVSLRTLSSSLTAIGSGEALKSVSVVPLVSGQITEVAITSGQTVKAGDLLAQLNSDSEEIARDQARVTLKSAEDTLARYQALGDTRAASQIELDELQTTRDAAELSLKDAEENLRERSIFAPISGTVGIVPVELGDYATTETEIAMLDDRSQIVVDFWVPERFSSKITIGQSVDAVSLALSGEVFQGQVSAIGSRIETDSRTLQIRALIENEDDMLRPGMSFVVSMGFEGEPYSAVDPLAVQWDADGSYVWVIEDGTAVRTPVRIVQRNTDLVLVDGDLSESAQVVIQGLIGLRDGAPVQMLGQNQTQSRPTTVAHQEDTPETPASQDVEG